VTTIDARVVRLHDLYLSGAIPGPAKHEVHPGLSRGSRENYLYFTLSPALNFQRNSPALWQSALDTYADVDTSFVFFPEDVVGRGPNATGSALLKHRLAIQTSRHPKIWYGLCETLNRAFSNDPREVLASANHDVERIVRLVQADRREEFPGLRGPKLSNYWLFILSQFTDAPLRNLAALSIIPDTHVIQATTYLGLTAHDSSPIVVERVWRETLLRLGLSPVVMHSALWRWSRNHFTPAV